MTWSSGVRCIPIYKTWQTYDSFREHISYVCKVHISCQPCDIWYIPYMVKYSTIWTHVYYYQVLLYHIMDTKCMGYSWNYDNSFLKCCIREWETYPMTLNNVCLASHVISLMSWLIDCYLLAVFSPGRLTFGIMNLSVLFVYSIYCLIEHV